ncbi:MAG: type II toxin-antitoxin system RelE/ParE family toxin [Deltaproteobacteria bacterium]|nr:type II toxin-antitoxin system RelE/ParE family toxin [Deltaproteobacteria bacterium]
MRLILAETALNDLDDILGYIQQHNPAAAVETVDRVLSAIEGQMEFPKMGRPGRAKGTRELVVSGLPYVVAYRVGADRVEIARVLHGARRWPRRL